MIDRIMDHPKLTMYTGLAVLCAIGVAYWYFTDEDTSTGFFQDIGTGAGEAVGDAVVDLADGLISGGAMAVGDKFGIPRTNMTECERALAEGRTWDASFACPAGTFIGSFFD